MIENSSTTNGGLMKPPQPGERPGYNPRVHPERRGEFVKQHIRRLGYKDLSKAGLYERAGEALADAGFLYIGEEKQWCKWDTEAGHYRNVIAEEVMAELNHWRLSKSLASEERHVVKTITDVTDKSILKTVKKTYEKAYGILVDDLGWSNSALRHLSSHNALLAHPFEFDVDPEILNCRNGFVNLKTGEFTPHSEPHSLLFRRVVNCDYDAGAECPRWFQYLNEAHPNDDSLPAAEQIIPYLQYAAGTAAIGRMPPWRLCFWIFGPTTTGKSVFANTLRWILAMYACVLHKSLLMRQGTENRMSSTLASLPGMRLVCVNEVPKGQIDDGVFKSLTSTDGESVRGQYKEGKTVDFTHTLLTTTNHTPMIDDAGGAVFMRLRPIPFLIRVPNADDGLEQTLRGEASGILNWIIAGAMRVLNEPGLYSQSPAVVREAVERYKASVNVIAAFIAECCDEAPDIVTGTASMFDVFMIYAKRTNSMLKLQKRSFTQMMREEGYEVVRYGSSARKRMHGYKGLSINDEYRKLLHEHKKMDIQEMNTIYDDDRA